MDDRTDSTAAAEHDEQVADIVVACDELMLASRFQTSGIELSVLRTESAVLERCAAGGAIVLAVDLDRFPNLAAQVRDAATDTSSETYILGFAPHVKTDLIVAARATCDKVVAKGAVIDRLRVLADAG